MKEDKDMKTVTGKEFGGERALFAVKDVKLVDCVFHAMQATCQNTILYAPVQPED